MKSVKTILAAALLAAAPAALPAQAVAPQAAPSVAPATAESPVAIGTTPNGMPAPQTVPATTADTGTAAAQTGVAPPAPAGPTPAKAGATPVFERPLPGLGMPDGRMGLQDQVTGVGVRAAWMHNAVLLPIITIICLVVLGLLLWVILRYRRGANPVPSRTSHNTVIEVLWTLLPVLVLVAIAVPSIKLIAAQYNPPKPDLTVKVIGHQWYWSYQYPDNGDFEIVSNMLKEAKETKPGERARSDADGPRLLAADEHMVVPAGAVVKLIVTSDDVIHAFAMPAFWNKMDAVPGRLNETWFKVDKPGLYFGQCSELCGARHAYMPINIEVVPPADFARWVAAKGGTMGPAGAVGADATATSPVSNPTPGNGAPTNPSDSVPPVPTGDTLINATTSAAPAVERASDSTGR